MNENFITKSIEFFFPLIRRLSPDERRTKSFEMSFSLAVFKFCATKHLFAGDFRRERGEPFAVFKVSQNFNNIY